MRLHGTGIWSFDLRYGEPGAIAESAAELESLGYSALWVPDVGGGDLFASLDHLLASTTSVVVATGILNIWLHEPADTHAWWSALGGPEQARVLLGLGVSHEGVIGNYERPLAAMQQYLDDVDALGMPSSSRCLAALGPKMLQLARTRSSGAHPYLVTPEQTANTREELGADGLVAVEQGVVVTSNGAEARAIARTALAGYLPLPNYRKSWRRQGFTEDDLADGGSDRFIDAMVAWGDAGAIAKRVQAHRDAGADHVCIQVLPVPGSPTPRAQWRELAPALVS